MTENVTYTKIATFDDYWALHRRIIGQAITAAINADPEEVARLRAARLRAADGQATVYRSRKRPVDQEPTDG